MTIEIQDNREEWLIKLGREYAAAVQEVECAKSGLQIAVGRLRKIEEDIARIGGYINDAAKEREVLKNNKETF